MSDSADAVRLSDPGPDIDARLDLFDPTEKSNHRPATKSKRREPAKSKRRKPAGGVVDQKQRLEFPTARLGQMRVLEPESSESLTEPSVKAESTALRRERQREKQRELAAARKAERLARRQLAIEEGEALEIHWRKQFRSMMLAWAMGLLLNALVLVYLWCYVASWERDQQPLTLNFSEIELQVEDQPVVDFHLPVDVMPVDVTPEETEIEHDSTLAEMLTLDAEMDLWEEPSSTVDPLGAGLFESVDSGGIAATESSGDDGGKRTSFFGLEGSGDRLVFVVDCSGSMISEGRFQRAVYELGQSLRLMEPNQEFLVVLYNSEIYPMLDTPLNKTKPIKATDRNVQRVMQWVTYQSPSGETFPARALQGSLEVRPTSVFFLSDGELADNTVQMLQQLNVSNSGTGARKVPIHTITLGSTGFGAGTMKQIADENDGLFTWVK